MAPEELTAELERIRERNEHLRTRYGYVGGLMALTGAKDDVPRLVAAIEAVLAEADSWAQEIPGAIGPGYNATRACGRRAREIITRELTSRAVAIAVGEEVGDGR